MGTPVRKRRPSIHQVLLTDEQLDWVRGSVNRAHERARRQDKAKRLEGALSNLCDKLLQVPPGPDGRLILETNRIELRFIEELATNEHAALIGVVVPGYQEKINKATELQERERLQAYLARSVNRSEFLLALVNQLRRMLGND